MSFILDALKKSENERARQHGPALLEARVVPPRRGPPAWAIVVGVVLVANLALLAYVLLRPAPVTPAAAPAAAPVAAAPAPAQAPAPAPAPVAAAPVAPATAAPAPQAYVPPVEPAASPPPAAVVNPADFAPARPPGTLPPRSLAAPSPVGNGGAGTMDPSLPTAADLNARGAGVPDLNLALHVYDDAPANRYVLINSQRLREGESTTDGVRVERITPEGALLSWRGQRFRLLPGE
jgi:general secretion pathway protein B